MSIATEAAEVFRDYEVDGVPASGRHNPDKAAIRALFAQVLATDMTFDPEEASPFGQRLNGEAVGKDFDVLQVNFTIGSGQRGNGVHVMSIASEGALGGQSVGGAMNGVGFGDAIVGNSYESVTGNGGTFAKVGDGLGNGVEGRCSTTDTGSAGYFIKQDPVAGVAGAGPSVWALNDSTNGEALRARSAAGNVEATTAIFDRLNGTQGTVLFARVLGGGARTALVRAGASHIVPTSSSTGTSNVIAHDYQINSNVTGSADTRALNMANASTGCVEAFGGFALVDGVNTTNYGLFLNAANATTNHALYCAGSGLASFGGDLRALNDGTQNIGTGGARFGTIFAATGTINTSDEREKSWLGNLTEAHLRAARRIGQKMGLYQWLDQIAEKGEDGARIHFGAKAQDVVEIFYDEGLEARPAKGDRPSFRHALLCYDEWDDVFQPDMQKTTVEVVETEWVHTGKSHTIAAHSFVLKRKGRKGRRVNIPEVRNPIMKRVEVKKQAEMWVNAGDVLVRPAGNRFGLRLDQLALFLSAAQEVRLAALEAK